MLKGTLSGVSSSMLEETISESGWYYEVESGGIAGPFLTFEDCHEAKNFAEFEMQTAGDATRLSLPTYISDAAILQLSGVLAHSSLTNQLSETTIAKIRPVQFFYDEPCLV